MFRALSKIVGTLWPVILVLWIGGAYWLLRTTPDLKDVARDDDSTFLPLNSDSVLARKLLKEGFPEDYAASAAGIIIENPEGLSEKDYEYVRSLTEWLASPEGPEGVLNVLSVTKDESLKNYLVSADGQAVITLVNLDSVFVSAPTRDAVDKILRHIQLTAPAGLSVGIVGDAALGHDYSVDLQKSLVTTTGVTCVFLLIVLFIIYRSPVAPIVPLATIGISFLVSRSLVALVATKFAVPPVVELFLVVILFGAGTDYCLFLIARFREETGRGLRTRPAMQRALSRVGGAIWASASTDIAGLAFMFFAKFGAFRNTGPCIALGLLVTLLAALTFTPSLIRLLGGLLIWPAHRDELVDTSSREKGFWFRLAGIVGRHPGTVLVVSLFLMLPLVRVGLSVKPSYDIYRALSKGSPARKSLEILRRHFTDSDILPVRIVFRSRENLWSARGLRSTDSFSRFLMQRPEISEVRSASQPLGKPIEALQTARLGGRIEKYFEGLERMKEGLDQIEKGLAGAEEEVSAYRKSLQEKAAQGLLFIFPTPGRESYLAGAESLQELSNGLSQAREGIGEVETGLEKLQDELAQFLRGGEFSFIGEEFLLSGRDLEAHPDLKAGLTHYISEDGFIGKIEVKLRSNPYSPEAMDDIIQLREAIKAYLPGSGFNLVSFHLQGATATTADVREITQKDLRRVITLILTAIFIILLFTLRSWTIPLYLIITILLSYFFTLGIVQYWFVPRMGYANVDWKVQFFMFVLLVAIGVDYNIFLVSRIREETKALGGFNGVRRAVGLTGGVISSCGVIMAGTFASLMTSPIKVMMELGFALSLGILIDTFFIRPVIVPAIAFILSRFKVTFRYEKEGSK